jgi:hypothetical protein
MREREQKPGDMVVSRQNREEAAANDQLAHPVLSLQRSAGNQATQRMLRSGIVPGTRPAYSARHRTGVAAVQRENPTTEELENPEARRQFRRNTGGRLFRALRWIGRVIPGPVGRYLRDMGRTGEGALEGMGETIERGHSRRDRYLERAEREAR